MIAVMIGSLTFRVLTDRTEKSESNDSKITHSKGVILAMTLAVAAGSFWIMTLWANNVSKKERQASGLIHITDLTEHVRRPKCLFQLSTSLSSR
jgi:hypothetical protein